jgi:L-alanine-DL-glutamate epimerase-like enolase superfamily enzyme
MAKHKSLKIEMAIKLAKATREFKRGMVEEVCKKEKVENMKDICAVFYGLSRKAVEIAAFGRIRHLAALSYSPQEIINRMEGNQ